VKAQLETELGAKNVIVTPNGVAIPAIADPRPRAGSFFLFVGNDKPHKNVDTLIEAFTRVPRARLILAGATFDRFRGHERVDARGFVSEHELSTLYRNAIALVMPSLEEGFGLPAAEAMAHGTAVITSNAPALVEVTGDAALHVDARDASALAAAMMRVMRDDDLRAMLGAKGIERTRLFTWKRCAELTAGAYRIAAK
jgi:glycosyltransferase involved in cell wall biosynthesis